MSLKREAILRGGEESSERGEQFQLRETVDARFPIFKPNKQGQMLQKTM